MKPLLLLLIPLFLHANILSPDAQAILRGTPLASSQQGSSLRSGGTISGMIMINSLFDEGAFAGIGGEILTSTDNFCTVNLPYSALAKLNSLPGVEYFSPARKVYSRLDKALPAGGLVLAHDGLPSGNAYSGKGVVIGIVDGGFDFNHPSFYDMLTGETRISRVWDQYGYGDGTPPAGYQYGREYTTKSEIAQRALSVGFGHSHGTHVAGIAAGSRVDLGSVTSVGVAPEAELVFVAVNFYDNGIVDGMRYIFDYAESVGKPAVVNFSLGSHYGPHDGSSAIDRIIEAFSGPGKIVVGSAGNERMDNLHLSKKSDESSVTSLVSVPYYEEGDIYLQQLSVWGERDKSNFSVRIALYNSSGSLLSKSNAFTVSDIVNQRGIAGSLNTQGYGDFKYFIFGTNKSPLNRKPELVIQLEAESNYVSDQFHAALELSGEGELHSWTTLSYKKLSGFYSKGFSGMVEGDSLYTVGEVGGTGRETISVGAFTSQTSYSNYWGGEVEAIGGTEGDVAPFSSMGPTADRRLKPDISAPGDILIAAFRSDYMDSTANDKRDYVAYVERFNGVDYYYGGMSGTSMSAPFVTGTVALMLEADPTLTPSQVKEILKQSAVSDEYTGIISSEGSYSWGRGKINADAALALVEDRRNTPPEMVGGGAAPTLRSIKAGTMELKMETSVVKSVDIRVMDLRGRELVRRSADLKQGMNLLPVDVKLLAPGAYLYQISGAGVNSLGKVVHLK